MPENMEETFTMSIKYSALQLAVYVLSLMIAVTSRATAQTVDAYWVGGPTGSWTVMSNWTPSDYWPDNLNGMHTYNVFIDNNATNNALVILSAPNPVAVNNLRIDVGDGLIVNIGGGLLVSNTAAVAGTLRVGDGTTVTTKNLLGASAVSFGILENETAGGLGRILVTDTAQWLNNATMLIGTGSIRDINNSGFLGSVGARLSGSIVNNGRIDIDISSPSTYDNLTITGTGFLSELAGAPAIWAPAAANSTLTIQGIQTFEGGHALAGGGLLIRGTTVNEGILRIGDGASAAFENLRGGSASSHGLLEQAVAGGHGEFVVNGTVEWIDNAARLVAFGSVRNISNSGFLGVVGAQLSGSIVNNGRIDFDILRTSTYDDLVITGLGSLAGLVSAQSVWAPAAANSTLTIRGTQTLEGGQAASSGGLLIQGTTINEGILRIANGAGATFENLQGRSGNPYGILENSVPGGTGAILVTGTAARLSNATRLIVSGNIGDIDNSGLLDSNGARFDGLVTNVGTISIDRASNSTYRAAVVDGLGGHITGPFSVWDPSGAGSTLTFRGAQIFDTSMTINGTVIVEGMLQTTPLVDVVFRNLNGGPGPSFGVLASEQPAVSTGRFVVTNSVSNITVASSGHLGSVGATFDGHIVNAGEISHDINAASTYRNAVIEGSGGRISGLENHVVVWNPADASSTLRFKGDQTITDAIQIAGNVTTEGTLRNQADVENVGRFTIATGGTLVGPSGYRQLSGETIVDGTMTQGFIDIQSGALSGTGMLVSAGAFTIGKTASVNPGAAAVGLLSLAGDTGPVVFDGTLIIDIAGTLTYDRLLVAGANGIQFGIDSLIEFHLSSLVADGDFIDNFVQTDQLLGFSNIDFSIVGLGAGMGYEVLMDAHNDLDLRFFRIANAVPEPASLLLLAIGLAGIAGVSGWRRGRG